MNKKQLNKLCIKLPIQTLNNIYTTHKPVAYGIGKPGHLEEVLYKCKHCSKPLKVNFYSRTCSNCGYRIDWGIMVNTNSHIANAYNIGSQNKQTQINNFINECNNTAAVDTPYDLQEYNIKQQIMFDKIYKEDN